MLRANQRDGCAMLMKVAAEAIVALAREGRHVGGTVGISDDGVRWHPARKSFLVLMKPLAKLMRGKSRAAFEKRRADLSIPEAVWFKPWVSLCTPWGEGERGVLEDLARYVFRVAITNSRIVGLEDRAVAICH